MILRQWLKLALAQQIGTAIADIGDMRLPIVNQRHRQGAAQAARGGLLFSIVENSLISLANGGFELILNGLRAGTFRQFAGLALAPTLCRAYLNRRVIIRWHRI